MRERPLDPGNELDVRGDRRVRFPASCERLGRIEFVQDPLRRVLAAAHPTSRFAHPSAAGMLPPPADHPSASVG
ncbi:hypothetical protein XM48_03630 [Leucobacter sp. Ag1]|nr:hypothetical protein XM48_03630 [Leucobacter sp. Ag1]